MITLRRLFCRCSAPAPAYELYDGAILPPAQKRFCGTRFKDNEYFVRSAEREACRLIDKGGLAADHRVVDVGCGYGRLAIGLTRVVGVVHYTGVDVDSNAIAWCTKHIHQHHPSYSFVHVDVKNERYNPSGSQPAAQVRLPVAGASANIVSLYSVFSHMTERDVQGYLHDIYRILVPGGIMFCTAFAENDVPPVSVNPDGYAFERCSGPLHVVRYDLEYLTTMVQRAGFTVVEISENDETDGQRALYLHKPSDADAEVR